MYSICELVNNTFVCSYAENAVATIDRKDMQWALVMIIFNKFLSLAIWRNLIVHFLLPFLYAYIVRVAPATTFKPDVKPDWNNIDNTSSEIIGHLRRGPLTVNQLQAEMEIYHNESELTTRLTLLKDNGVVTRLNRYPEEAMWVA
jgi:hypothetical protein